ncbi:MAG: DUF4199 domain-containing protein [Saprospiraceae bacterium]|nr:DUF4199 domain-containing protein [Saprospiraceae bacterium]
MNQLENHPVRNGLILGVASIVFTLGLYLINPKFMLSWGSWAGIIIMVYFMRKSVLDQKKDNKGFISLGEGFKMGWLTYILGTVISTLFSFVLINYIDPSLIEILKDIQIEAIEQISKSFNMPEDTMQAQIEAIEDTNPFSVASLGIALPISFLFPGAVIAIIIASVLKKNVPDAKM